MNICIHSHDCRLRTNHDHGLNQLTPEFNPDSGLNQLTPEFWGICQISHTPTHHTVRLQNKQLPTHFQLLSFVPTLLRPYFPLYLLPFVPTLLCPVLYPCHHTIKCNPHPSQQAYASESSQNPNI